MSPTIRDLREGRVDISTIERHRYLGRVQVDPSEHGAFTQRDEPNLWDELLHEAAQRR